MKNKAILVLYTDEVSLTASNRTVVFADMKELTSFCKIQKIAEVDIIVNSEVQIYERSSMPVVPYLDRQIYIYQKLKQLKAKGQFAKVPDPSFLIVAGVSTDPLLHSLLNELNVIQVKVASLRLFALEIEKCLSQPLDKAKWNLVLLEQQALLYVSVFKGNRLMFYRNTAVEELQLILDEVHHHPDYYQEEMEIYAINCRQEIENAQYIELKDPYHTIAQKKAALDLKDRKLNYGKILYVANFGLIALLGCLLLGYMGLLGQYRQNKTLQQQQEILTEQIQAKHAQLPSGIQLDLSLVKHNRSDSALPMLTAIQALHQTVKNFAWIQEATYTHHRSPLFVERLVLKPKKQNPNAKQRHQINTLLQQAIPHAVVVAWLPVGQIEVTGTPEP